MPNRLLYGLGWLYGRFRRPEPWDPRVPDDVRMLTEVQSEPQIAMIVPVQSESVVRRAVNAFVRGERP